ncbi:MAG: efflux transporter, family, subunit [Bryobacterales bacterium]|nr:efflux transporter, family, subunit [Bryobacterales bacterium]
MMNAMNSKAVTALAGMLLLAGCGEKQPLDPPPVSASTAVPGRITIGENSPQLRQLKVEPVVASEVPASSVVAPGKIEVNPNRVSHVVLPVSGRVMSVLVKLGDSVDQGAAVLRIESTDSDTAVAAYAQAQAAVAQARSVLLKVSADLDRARDLYEHKAIANKEVLNDESIVAQSHSSLDQAEAAERQSLRRLQLLGLKPGEFGQQLTVTAPVSGKILEVTVVPGEYRNDLSASLMTIADLSSVWAVSEVPETDIRFIRMGEPLAVELSAYPGEAFRAKVTRIADTVDPQTRTVKVSAQLSNPQGRLRPEMYGQIRHVGAMAKLPVIPAGAVVQNEGVSMVYREISTGVFEPVTVTVGDRVGDRVTVRSGISAGDRIVTEGALLLKASS